MKAYWISLCLGLTTVVHAAPEIRHAWDLVYPAAAHPEQYAQRTTGHFGKKFVGVAERRFFPNPNTPGMLRGKNQAGVVHAALLIAKDGSVKEIAILGQTPAGIADDVVLNFFRKIVFIGERADKRAIEYQTELVLVFKPAAKEG